MSIDLIGLFVDYPVHDGYIVAHPPVNHHTSDLSRLKSEFIPILEKAMTTGETLCSEIQLVPCSLRTVEPGESSIGNEVPFVTMQPYKSTTTPDNELTSVRFIEDTYARACTLRDYVELCDLFGYGCDHIEPSDDAVVDPAQLFRPMQKYADVTFRTTDDIFKFAVDIKITELMRQKLNKYNAAQHSERNILLRALTEAIQNRVRFRWGLMEGEHRMCIYRYLTMGYEISEMPVARVSKKDHICGGKDSPVHTIQTVTAYINPDGCFDRGFVSKCRSHSESVARNSELGKGRSWKDYLYDIAYKSPVSQVTWGKDIISLSDADFKTFLPPYNQACRLFNMLANSSMGAMMLNETLINSRRKGGNPPESIPAVKKKFQVYFKPGTGSNAFYTIWRKTITRSEGMNKQLRGLVMIQLYGIFDARSNQIFKTRLNSTLPGYPQITLSPAIMDQVGHGFHPRWVETYILDPIWDITTIFKRVISAARQKTKDTHGNIKLEWILMSVFVSEVLKVMNKYGPCPMEFMKANEKEYFEILDGLPDIEEKKLMESRREDMVNFMKNNPKLNSVLEAIMLKLPKYFEIDTKLHSEMYAGLVSAQANYMNDMSRGDIDMGHIEFSHFNLLVPTHKKSDNQTATLSTIIESILRYEMTCWGISNLPKQKAKKKEPRQRSKKTNQQDGDDKKQTANKEKEHKDKTKDKEETDITAKTDTTATKRQTRPRRQPKELLKKVNPIKYTEKTDTTRHEKYNEMRTCVLEAMGQFRTIITTDKPNQKISTKYLQSAYNIMRDNVINFVHDTDIWINDLPTEEKQKSALLSTGRKPSEIFPSTERNDNDEDEDEDDAKDEDDNDSTSKYNTDSDKDDDSSYVEDDP